jgi:hypothetical protein
MELSILEAMQREEVMTKHWDCKLMFKKEEDTPEIDLLDYVNLTQQKEDKILNNPSYPMFVYTNSLIDSMALETGKNSRRSSIHQES